MTSVGSLMTTFSPSPSCLTDYYRINATISTIISNQISTYAYLQLGPTSTSDCVPPSFAPTGVYYSPGICPSGYSQACAIVVKSGSATETQATCCPSNYVCQTETAPWPWYTTEMCTLAVETATTITITTSLADTTSIFPSYINVGINAYGISIRYQARDFATSSSSSTSTSSSISTSSSSSSPSTSSPAAAAISSSSLSAGAIAGIVIGAIAALAILGTIIFFIRRNKLRQLQHGAMAPSPKIFQQIFPRNPRNPTELPAVREVSELE